MTISIGYRREQENQPEYFIGISELYNPIIHGASNIQFNSHLFLHHREVRWTIYCKFDIYTRRVFDRIV